MRLSQIFPLVTILPWTAIAVTIKHLRIDFPPETGLSTSKFRQLQWDFGVRYNDTFRGENIKWSSLRSSKPDQFVADKFTILRLPLNADLTGVEDWFRGRFEVGRSPEFSSVEEGEMPSANIEAIRLFFIKNPSYTRPIRSARQYSTDLQTIKRSADTVYPFIRPGQGAIWTRANFRRPKSDGRTTVEVKHDHGELDKVAEYMMKDKGKSVQCVDWIIWNGPIVPARIPLLPAWNANEQEMYY